MTIVAGSNVNILSTVTATDTCGNDISSSISISGNYDRNVPGTYHVTLSVTDLLGKSASKEITITVTKKTVVTTPTTTTQPTTTSDSGSKRPSQYIPPTYNTTEPTKEDTSNTEPITPETDNTTKTEDNTIETPSETDSTTTEDSSSETTSPQNVENNSSDIY